MKNKLVLGILLLVIGLAISLGALFLQKGFLFESNKRDDQSTHELRVRLKWVHQAQFAGFYAAVENGNYRDEGLTVQLSPGGQDMNALRTVVNGTDDIGIWGAEQVMIARSQGMKVTAIGVVYQDTAACFVARKTSGINHFRDIVGHKVGVQHGTDVDTIYSALLEIHNISRSAVTEIPVAYNLPLFFQGEVEVWPSYVVNEPYLIEKRGIPVSIIYPQDNGLRFYGDAILCHDDFAKKNREQLKGFMRATIKGWKWALAHPEEAAKLCKKYDRSLDLDHQIQMIKASTPLIEGTAGRLMEMTDERWMAISGILRKHKLMDTDVSVSQVYTNEYLPQ